MYRAKVSAVPFGSNLSIEGLLLEDGVYAMGVSQVAALNLVTPNNATKEVKALLGLDTPLLQTATELNSKKVNIIFLPQFIEIVQKKAFQGNATAQTIAIGLMGLSLQELFNDAFGVESNARTRQEALNKIMDSASPWERLVEAKTNKKISKWFGGRAAETFWWRYLYNFLSPEERIKLDQLNPLVRTASGRTDRSSRIHQWIATEEGIRDRLQRKMQRIVDILDSSTGRQDFVTRMSRIDGFNQMGFDL